MHTETQRYSEQTSSHTQSQSGTWAGDARWDSRRVCLSPLKMRPCGARGSLLQQHHTSAPRSGCVNVRWSCPTQQAQRPTNKSKVAARVPQCAPPRAFVWFVDIHSVEMMHLSPSLVPNPRLHSLSLFVMNLSLVVSMYLCLCCVVRFCVCFCVSVRLLPPPVCLSFCFTAT